MKLCLSVAPSSIQEARAKLKQGSHPADIIEIRIDGMRGLALEKLLARPRPKVIITNRRKEEGGKFRGSPDEQLEILTQAVSLGAEYVDVEMSYGPEVLKPLLAKRGHSSIIVSHHNFSETPQDLHATILHALGVPLSDLGKNTGIIRPPFSSGKPVMGLFG